MTKEFTYIFIDKNNRSNSFATDSRKIISENTGLDPSTINRVFVDSNIYCEKKGNFEIMKLSKR